MLIYPYFCTEKTFRKNAEWAKLKITPIEPPEGAIGAWLVEDRFLNARTILSTATAGEYIVESKSSDSPSPVSVKVHLNGNQVGIVYAIDNGKRIQCGKFLEKYFPLGAMVSDLSHFNMLKMQDTFKGETVNGKIKYTNFRHRKDTKRRHKRGQISPRSIPRKPKAAIW